MRVFTTLILSLALCGCNTFSDRQAFYTSALTQEAWFAIQAEPAPDAWDSFNSLLAKVPESYREQVKQEALKEATARAAKNQSTVLQ